MLKQSQAHIKNQEVKSSRTWNRPPPWRHLFNLVHPVQKPVRLQWGHQLDSSAGSALCFFPVHLTIKQDGLNATHTHTLGTACDDFGIIYYVPHFTIFYPCFLANINWTLNCLDVMDHAGQIQPQTRRKINHQKTTTVLFQWVVYILKTVNKHACTCTHWSFNIDNHSELRKHFKIIHPIVLGDGSSKERQLVHVHIIQMNHPHSWGVCFFFVQFSWFGMLAPTLFQ